MARKKKVGFDTVTLSTEFLSDSDLTRVHHNIGASGIVILLSIYLQAFKRKGYFFPVNVLTLGVVCGESFSTPADVKSAIEKMLDLGIFHREMYEKYQILTSAKLQKIYVAQSKTAKRTADIAPEYSLIDINDASSGTKTLSDIELQELSRKIVQNWNMLHADGKGADMKVTEDLITMPDFLESLRAITEKYDATSDIITWIDLERNAFVEHPHIGLGQIVGHEPTFRMLYNMGEPTNFIPGEFSPPRNMIHPAVIQEARMKRSGYSEEEITEVTSRLLEQHQEAVPEMPIPDQPPTPFSPESIQEALDADDEDDGYDDTVTDQKKQEEEEPTQIHDENVVTVYQDYASVQPESIPVFITNESTSAVILEGDENNPTEQIPPEEELESPTRFTLPNDLPSPAPPCSPKKWFTNLRNQPIIMDGKELLSPEEEARREVLRREKEEVERISAMEDQKSDDNSPYITEYDPELSPLLKQILHTFNTKYEEQNYPYMDELRIDEEFFSQEKHALDYLRAYIEKDERCRDIEFWKVMVDGVIHLFTFRSRHWKQEKPHCLFDVLTPPIVPETEKRDRLRLLDSFIGYFNYPNKLSDPTAREAGKIFMQMLEQEHKLIQQKEENGGNETEQTEQNEAVDEADYPENITPVQKRLLDAMRSNPEIPEGDRGWLEERILHPERFKDPDKPYGDRTDPLPWAKKNPPSYEELIQDPDFCHPLAHGNSLKARE